MARAAIRGRLTWLIGRVEEIVEETARVRSLRLDVPGWLGHRPGQHVDVRLTAEDGYQAQRSYSIATPEDGTHVTLTVERIADGEVSSYLVDELRVGDRLELRGPIGGYFVWEPQDGGPVFLAGGGSGVVPLMAMLRARVAAAAVSRAGSVGGPSAGGASAGDDVPVRLLYSARSPDELIYRDELERAAALDGIDVAWTLTRSQPESWSGYSRRVDREMLAETAWPPARRPVSLVCGPTGFVETVASALVELGHDPGSIRTERFGPSGG